MQCPVRNVQLWEDPEFSTVSSKATEMRRVLKRVAEQRETKFCARAAPKKKAKVENAEDAGEASTRPTGPAPTPLSESQKARATKLLAKMTAATEQSVLLAEDLEKNEGGLKEFIHRKARS